MPLFGPPNIETLKDKGDMQGLIKALRHKDALVRRKAAEALSTTRDPRAVEALIDALGASRRPIGSYDSAVVEALGTLGDPRAVEPLVKVLEGRLGAHDLLSLTERNYLSRDEQLHIESVRAKAALALGKLHDARAVAPLIDAALRDVYRWVVESAREALRELGEPAVQLLISRLNAPDEDERRLVGEVFDAMGWQPATAKERAAFAVAAGRFDDAVKEGEVAIPYLRAELKAVEEETQGWKWGSPPLDLCLALARLGESDAIEFLARALSDRDHHVRWEAVRAIADLNDVRFADPLCAVLDDPDEWVRHGALRALLDIGPAAASSVAHTLETESVLLTTLQSAAEIRFDETRSPPFEPEPPWFFDVLRESYWTWRARTVTNPLYEQALETEEPYIGAIRVWMLTLVEDFEILPQLRPRRDKIIEAADKRHRIIDAGGEPDPFSHEPGISESWDQKWWVFREAIEAMIEVNDARAST